MEQTRKRCNSIKLLTVMLASCVISGHGLAASSQDDLSASILEASEGNFAVNGGVEDGLTNWGVNAGTLYHSQWTPHTGSKSAYIYDRTNTWNGLTYNPGATLKNGSQYHVSVWVKLASDAYDTTVKLTAKRQDDSDSSTYNEYTGIATATASANSWTLLEGYYTQSGTAFEYFIIETGTDETVSYYADDFMVSGDVDSGSGNTGKVQFVGNITTNGSVRSDFVQYWDQITPENEGKWGSVERSRDSYNWSGLDAAYNYAKANNIPFKQHTFVWGSQYPSWITSLSASEQAAEIEEWIEDYCDRYPDTEMIDVVNEAIPSHAPANYAANAFGSDWIIDSFRLAEKHCPNSILILNDYNVLSWNTNDFISMAKPAVNAGVVDAIGLQAHGLESWTATQIKEKLDKLANELGLPIYISEYDINKSSDSEQLSIMQSQFPVFYEHPSVVGITLWGYVHGATWRDNTGLIYSGGTQRPAMTWLMNYLDSK